MRKEPLRTARKIALMGLLLAMAAALSFFEGQLAAMLLLPPGVKLGLSNIVVMVCLFALGGRAAFTLAGLKALFVLLTRGPVAALLSGCGGVAAVAVMLLLAHAPRLSKQFISIFGALFHNVGQIVAACAVMGSAYALYYLPVLLLSGLATGVFTGSLLRLVMPYLRKGDAVFK